MVESFTLTKEIESLTANTTCELLIPEYIGHIKSAFYALKTEILFQHLLSGNPKNDVLMEINEMVDEIKVPSTENLLFECPVVQAQIKELSEQGINSSQLEALKARVQFEHLGCQIKGNEKNFSALAKNILKLDDEDRVSLFADCDIQKGIASLYDCVEKKEITSVQGRIKEIFKSMVKAQVAKISEHEKRMVAEAAAEALPKPLPKPLPMPAELLALLKLLQELLHKPLLMPNELIKQNKRPIALRGLSCPCN